MGKSGNRAPPVVAPAAVQSRGVAIDILRQLQAHRSYFRESVRVVPQRAPSQQQFEMAEGGAASTDDVSAASSFHSSRGDSVPAAMAAATRATAAGDDEDDLEALEFVARLRSKGKIEKMTTGRTAHNPRNLKHMWRLDLESGVPDVHGLSNTDLLTGCATSSRTPLPCALFCIPLHIMVMAVAQHHTHISFPRVGGCTICLSLASPQRVC